MSDHYEPPTDRRGLAMAAVWIAAAVVTLAGRTLARVLTTRRPAWQPLAVAFVVLGGVAAWRSGDAVTVGPTLVRAASEPSGAAGALDAVPTAQPFGNAEGLATPTADPRLQPGYVDPSAQAETAPQVPDLGPPPYLTDGLQPHWPEIDAAAREHGLDPWAWAAVIVVECPLGVDSVPVPSCQYNNASRAGGLAQITDETAVDIAFRSGYSCSEEKFDPVTSLRCGAYHFRDLLRAAGSYWRADDELPALQLAAIAYNAGAGSSAYSGARGAAGSGGDVCGGIPLGFDPQTLRYCRDIARMWGQAVDQRVAAPPPGIVPRVAPGAPSHLEVSSVQP